MEAGSEGEIDRNVNQSPTEGSKRPKRQMKTPFQLSVLEKTYSGAFAFCFCFTGPFIYSFMYCSSWWLCFVCELWVFYLWIFLDDSASVTSRAACFQVFGSSF